jgi:dTDP-4-dehydrorhamnose reductase
MLDDRLPLLVTGVAGVAGLSAFHHFQERFPGQVYGLRPEKNWRLEKQAVIACDLEDHLPFHNIFADRRFKAVLHCGGSCALKACELDPKMAERVNVIAVESLLSAIRAEEQRNEVPVRLVFLSIDLVYSGFKGGDYCEYDAPDPVTVYGRTMAMAEQMVRAEKPDATILRISLPMGPSFNGHAGAIDWIAGRFKRGLPATLYFDEVRTPTYVECLNEVCEFFLNNDIGGIFHAGGKRKMTLYEIAQVVNCVGGFDPDLLNGCYRIEAGALPPRAGNVTMNNEKLVQTMGRDPFAKWPFDQELFPSHRDWHREHPRDLTEFNGSLGKMARLLYRRCTQGMLEI